MSDPDASERERRYTFPRSHRLKRQRLIRSLFDRSRTDVETVAVGCVRLLFRVVPREATGYDVSLQIGFAPGRRRSAVERNRVRRVLREVYRVHQHLLVGLFQHTDRALIVLVLFRGNPQHVAECVPRDLPEAMRRVAERFSEEKKEA